MAIVKTTTKNPKTLHGILEYVADLNKTRTEFISGAGISTKYAYDEMKLVKYVHHKTDRRQYKQFIIAFNETESLMLSNEFLKKLAQEISAYFSSKYQTLWSIHFDSKNKHIHFIVNSVNTFTGDKLSFWKQELYDFKLFIDQLIQSYGMSPVKMYGHQPPAEKQ